VAVAEVGVREGGKEGGRVVDMCLADL
jgi:hypothetical protein